MKSHHSPKEESRQACGEVGHAADGVNAERVTTPRTSHALWALWQEMLAGSKWWCAADLDGLHIEAVSDGYALRAVAYMHICRRCFSETDRMMGEVGICSRCQLASPCIFRLVRVIFTRPGDGDFSRLMQRMSSLNLRDLHPAIIPDERLDIELSKWPEFANGNEATWWST